MVAKAVEKIRELHSGIEALGKEDNERMQSFLVFVQACQKAGALDVKTKQLITVALGLYAQCEACIVEHTEEALKAGATREELLETAFVVVLMGGGPAMAWSATVLRDALDTFAPLAGK